MNKTYYVYIITNHTNTVLYTGVTNDIARRIFEHKSGSIKNSFSKRYKLYKLVWLESFNDINFAIQHEKRIKGWTRKKKLLMIEENNPNWNDLGKDLL